MEIDYVKIYEAVTLLNHKNLNPSRFQLFQNYPNPFNPNTTLKYIIPDDDIVKITIYDMLGNEIKNLINTKQSSGFKSIQWNATNNLEKSVSAGTYLYSIEVGGYRKTKNDSSEIIYYRQNIFNVNKYVLLNTVILLRLVYRWYGLIFLIVYFFKEI